MKLVRLLLSVALVGGVALAQQPIIKNGVRFVMAQDLVKASVQGGVRTEDFIQSPRAVQTGDILREEITVQNVKGRAISELTVGIPIPRETVLSGSVTPDSARWKVAYSVDGGRTYSPKPMQEVKAMENSKPVLRQQLAPPESYTNVRWTVANLAKDETLKLSFRVRVK
ncbi:hypothetical protein [Deinococcus arenicola]|uniref:DUF11 domain-containing protein n=1 Tax=Deinococcus arenicola TaxID=2994950 RepID=A0ABU4DQ80_9DEIO|nr:hypothetical protein [Deinococcus sp. ZS9-10]MDV6374249.1 hypothetical protein [Deinococcus sp. ZS9-10]